MKYTRNVSSTLVRLAACAALALGFVCHSLAADSKVDGTWTWTMQGREGSTPRKMTLKLKTEGEKLTGKMIMPGRQGGDPREVDIQEGKVKGDEVSFNVVREFNGNKMVSKYTAKVAGDTLKGKMEFDRQGEKTSRDWEAKREVEKK